MRLTEVFILTEEEKKGEGRKRSLEYFLLGFDPSRNWIFGGDIYLLVTMFKDFFPPSFILLIIHCISSSYLLLGNPLLS